MSIAVMKDAAIAVSEEPQASANGAQPVLVVEHVAKSYGSVRALDDVSLTVRAGEFVAVLGPNGAGKSTLLQLLTGLFSPDRGRIIVLGHDLRHDAVRALAGIGVVFQQQTLDLELSVRANLQFHADLHGLSRRVAHQRIGVALERYGLTDRRRSRARTLSGGNRRRLELARALLHKPHVLFMDEATVGLDPGSRRDILEEMVRLKQTENIGVLWTTHLIDEVDYADRLIILRQGHVLFDGTQRGLLEREGSNDFAATVISMMGTDTGDTAGAVALERPAAAASGEL
jgi:ABC-2 type transport system ATP-binding protein